MKQLKIVKRGLLNLFDIEKINDTITRLKFIVAEIHLDMSGWIRGTRCWGEFRNPVRDTLR